MTPSTEPTRIWIAPAEPARPRIVRSILLGALVLSGIVAALAILAALAAAALAGAVLFVAIVLIVRVVRAARRIAGGASGMADDGRRNVRVVRR